MLLFLSSLAALAQVQVTNIEGFSTDERGWHEAMECAAMRPHLEGKDILYQDELELFDLARKAAEQIGSRIGKEAEETERRIEGYIQRHAARNPRSLSGNAVFCLEKISSARQPRTN